MADVRLIDADVMIKDIMESVIEVSGDSGLAEEAVKCYQAVILKYIDTMPTINPDDCRLHGRWKEVTAIHLKTGETRDARKCSVCGSGYFHYDLSSNTSEDIPNYCPHCGAKMDGKEQDNA